MLMFIVTDFNTGKKYRVHCEDRSEAITLSHKALGVFAHSTIDIRDEEELDVVFGITDANTIPELPQ